MGPARLETFADGVFAIAATLLILTVDGAVGGEGIDLGADLRHAWPSYVAYVVSFVTIGIMWINHHAVMDLVERVDRRFLIANMFYASRGGRLLRADCDPRVVAGISRT